MIQIQPQNRSAFYPVNGLQPAVRFFGPQLSGLQAVQKADIVQFGGKAPAETYDIAVLGGGLAGLTAAYLAQQKGLKVVVLESQDRLGGNAKTGYKRTEKGEKALSFPVGASVLGVANERQRQFFKELGIDVSDPKYTIHTDIAYFDGEWVSIDPTKSKPNTWQREFADGATQFIQMLRNILKPVDGKTHFPLKDAPKSMFAWDKLDLKSFLNAFPEKVRQFFETNLRSDISDDMERISALAGIIDQGADQGERCLFPGGNYHVIKKMLAKFQNSDNPVTFLKQSPLVRVEEDANSATVTYLNPKGKEQTLKATQVMMAIPSHRVPHVMALPQETAQFLSSIKRGSYALMNIFVDEAPIQSNTYYKFPYAKWTADAVLTNEFQDPELPIGSKAKSVITVYIPILTSLQKDFKSQKQLEKEVLEEMSIGFPWLKKAIKGTRLTYYPEAMSSPAPGQMEQMAEFDRQLSPRVRMIHSDVSGTFAARGAVDEAMSAMDALDMSQFGKTKHQNS
jgi:protoporphyrinogen oxidase